MEEAKAVPTKTTQIPKPQNTARNLPPPPPLPPQNKKKRKLDVVDIQKSNYFKICALVRDLRPYFIEVLQTPDFRNSKAAHEIQKKMELMMDSYKQMGREKISIKKCKNLPINQVLPGESTDERKPLKRHQEEKQAQRPKPDEASEKSVKSPEEKPSLDETIPEMKKLREDEIRGTYIVGGSPFGWNFIMYPSTKLLYYGIIQQRLCSAETFNHSTFGGRFGIF